MFLNAMTDLFYVGGRWWWAGAMGDVCPPPDIWRSLFVWHARYRKVARFFFGNYGNYGFLIARERNRDESHNCFNRGSPDG